MAVRLCIASNGADCHVDAEWLQIVQKFKLEPYPGVELQPTLRIVLSPGEQVPVRFVDRD